MVSTAFDLELHHIDRMARDELLAAIRSGQDYLPPGLADRLEAASTDYLQLLLLAVRLLQVLQRMHNR